MTDFEELLMASPAVLYSVRLQGDVGPVYVSPNIRKVLGYTPEEILGKSTWWQERLHPHDRDSAIDRMNHALPNATHYAHEYRIRHKFGHYIWVHDELNILRSEDGAPRALVGSWLDVSDRVEAQRLALSHAALDNMPFGVISLDKNLEIQTMNRWAREIVEDRDGISVGPDNKCRLDRSEADRDFQKTVASLLHGAPPQGVALRVQRPSHSRPYAVLVASVSLPDIGDGTDTKRCVVFIQDPSSKRCPCPRVIGDMYGLTPSESRLVANMISGGILKEAAAEIGIAEGSARTYLKNVFQKTGARNQMELVRMVLLGPATFWGHDS